MTEEDAKEILKPTPESTEYLEFYGNSHDILLGCSDVPSAIALFRELFKTYEQ